LQGEVLSRFVLVGAAAVAAEGGANSSNSRANGEHAMATAVSI
jgi:hypothetical protein